MQKINRVSELFRFAKKRLTAQELAVIRGRNTKNTKLTDSEIDIMADADIDGSVPGACAPWFLSEAQRELFDEHCLQFAMPGDKPALRRIFRHMAFFKTYDWHIFSTEAGRFLVRSYLPTLGVPAQYVDLDHVRNI
jgi:hypothetical protein